MTPQDRIAELRDELEAQASALSRVCPLSKCAAAPGEPCFGATYDGDVVISGVRRMGSVGRIRFVHQERIRR